MNAKKLVLVALCAMLVSCAKDVTVSNSESSVQELNAMSSENSFAKILSKAVSENENLRVFIKNQALRQFDKDFDVFYPYVKNMIVSGDDTFRDILCRYTSEEELAKIEQSCPKLNILVPDWSWINGDCFGVNNWDTSSDEVCVGCSQLGGSSFLYSDGDFCGNLQKGDIPSFPVLIIKSNERMVVKGVTTKGGELEYAFLSPEFDGSCVTTKSGGKWVNYDIDLVENPEMPDAFVAESKIDPKVIAAYNECKDTPEAAQRDYVYYGLTKENSTGKRNQYIKEYIACMRLDNADSYALYDDSGDIRFVPIEKDSEAYTNEELLKKIWTDGMLDFHFYISIASKDGKVSVSDKYVTLKFGDLFDVIKTHVSFRHKVTWGPGRKWIYRVDKDCFVPKWCNINVELPRWDVGYESSNMVISVVEYDASVKSTMTISNSYEFMNNFSSSVEYQSPQSTWGSVKVGFGYGLSSKSSRSCSTTIEIESGSDKLGDANVYYMEPIIVEPGIKNGVKGYRLNVFSTDYCKLMVLPSTL